MTARGSGKHTGRGHVDEWDTTVVVWNATVARIPEASPAGGEERREDRPPAAEAEPPPPPASARPRRYHGAGRAGESPRFVAGGVAERTNAAVSKTVIRR
jgi:hypothetical protein